MHAPSARHSGCGAWRLMRGLIRVIVRRCTMRAKFSCASRIRWKLPLVFTRNVLQLHGPPRRHRGPAGTTPPRQAGRVRLVTTSSTGPGRSARTKSRSEVAVTTTPRTIAFISRAQYFPPDGGSSALVSLLATSLNGGWVVGSLGRWVVGSLGRWVVGLLA